MSQIWNDSRVPQPPICSVRSRIHHDKITQVKSILFDGISTYEKCDFLNNEAALLSRMLYKIKRPFRQDKATKSLSKIMKELRSHLKMNLKNLFINFKNCLPAKLNVEEKFTNLPTRQMLKFILLRLQTHSKLYIRIINICEECGKYLSFRAKLGWNSYIMLFVLSIISRIWIVCFYLLKKTIDWYNNLYLHLNEFKLTISFLDEYEFPSDLQVWLGDDWIELSGIKKNIIDELFIVLSSDDDDDNDMDVTVLFNKYIKSEELDGDDDEDMIEVVEQIGSKKSHHHEDLGLKRRHTEEDCGETIKRSSMKKKKRKNN